MFVKPRTSLLVFPILSLLFLGCRETPENNQQKSIDMVTIRTLGLAYLEENKLKEAEAEFLKLIEIAPDEALGYANLGLVYMRMGKPTESEAQLREGLTREPNDPDIRLNLAEIYEQTQRNDAAKALLQETLTASPDHAKTLYKLARLLGKSKDSQERVIAGVHLTRLAELLPANVTVRLQLVEALARNSKADEAARHMEEIRQQMPELPKESVDYFNKALTAMRDASPQDALTPALIFHNFMKVTPLYQAGLRDLRSATGPLTGSPVLTFSRDVSIQMKAQEIVLGALRFTDATASSGLAVASRSTTEAGSAPENISALVLADFDRDGDQDFYIGGVSANAKESSSFLFRNDFGQFVDISETAGIRHGGRDLTATFADYDNDGFLDLFVGNINGNRLYRNVEAGKFSNVSRLAGITGAGIGQAARLADFDHDGDLDLYLGRSGPNQFFRNNLDGTFSELSDRAGVSGPNAVTRDLAFGDFDEDGDLDIFLVNESGSNVLYTNLRQGRFQDVTQECGLTGAGGSGAVAAGDYNNDGFLDLFVTGLEEGRHYLYRNKGDGTFEVDRGSKQMNDLLQRVVALDIEFLDFDNDGFLDILLVGRTTEGQSDRAVLIFHNDATGRFEDSSALLPPDALSGNRVAVADYDEDGDVDLFLATLDGGVRLLRNDGGNANKYLKVQLVGLRTGSGKNNHFGVGSKVEVRAGDLYQTRLVTDPVSHFGLGQRLKADVVRILWPNGVPQNLFHPASDQYLIEEQTLKGSCAFVYAWDGQKYEFVTDVMWRSALGMPLGIMGGETAYAFPNSSQDHFKIPGDLLDEKDGVYSLQVTEELWETAYFDEVNLIAVDHPDSVDVFVDERFVPPPIPPLEVFTVANQQTPISAVDEKGNDLLPLIRAKDHRYVSDLAPARYQGVTETHDLVLDLGDLSKKDRVVLFLNGWIFPTDASINLALAQSDRIKVYPPYLQVPDENGRWHTVLENLSFPTGKDKTVVAELTGKFICQDFRVRIRTNMQVSWDRVFFSTHLQNLPITITEMQPIKADLHYRGFSRLYRKGGRHGPHWFEYSDVSTEPKWRDLIGNYTRFGDVVPLLLERDDRFVIMNAGDEVTLEFDAAMPPELPVGWTRDFIVYTDGWIKDGDLNTAHGQTVAPLPFHNMSQYPYGSYESYPADEAHQKYLRDYNTRRVDTQRFRDLLRRSK